MDWVFLICKFFLLFVFKLFSKFNVFICLLNVFDFVFVFSFFLVIIFDWMILSVIILVLLFIFFMFNVGCFFVLGLLFIIFFFKEFEDEFIVNGEFILKLNFEFCMKFVIVFFFWKIFVVLLYVWVVVFLVVNVFSYRCLFLGVWILVLYVFYGCFFILIKCEKNIFWFCIKIF